MDRAQAVVPGMAAALFQAQFAGGKVKFVMEDGHIGKRQLPEGKGGLHRLAGKVHEGFGFQKRHFLGPEAAFGDKALKRLAPGGEAMVGGDAVKRHETDVVPVAGIFRARIAKSYEQLHGDPRSCRASPGSVGIAVGRGRLNRPRKSERGTRRPPALVSTGRCLKRLLRLRRQPDPQGRPRWRSRSSGRSWV